MIKEYLSELFNNPICELEYKHDYELLLAVVMSAQTTDKRVNMVNKILFSKYKSIDDLVYADIKDIENIIKPIGTYKKKAKFIKEIVIKLKDNNYIVPNNRKFLESLDGVGRKTASVFLSVIYNEPNIAVDTHVTRVSKRLRLASEKDDVIKIEKKLKKYFDKVDWSAMHHRFVLFGRYYCKSINPICNDCKLKSICKYYKKNY